MYICRVNYRIAFRDSDRPYISHMVNAAINTVNIIPGNLYRLVSNAFYIIYTTLANAYVAS